MFRVPGVRKKAKNLVTRVVNCMSYDYHILTCCIRNNVVNMVSCRVLFQEVYDSSKLISETRVFV